MIQCMLKRDLNGGWSTPNSAILMPLTGAINNCAEIIQQLQTLEPNESDARNFRNPNRTVELIHARLNYFQTYEVGNLDRQELVALLVELALGIRGLKETSTHQILAQINQSIGEVPTLHEAAIHGYNPLIELLINSGAKVDTADKYGWQPLHETAKYGHKEMAELLLAKGAKVDPIDKYGWQPLHWAAKHGHKEMVALLLMRGAKVDAVAKDGKQPLHLAAWHGNKEVVRLLLANGAKADASDKNGKLPSNEAEENCHKDVVELLQTAKRNEPLFKVYRKQGYLTRFLDKKPFPIEQSYINLAIVDQESYESSIDNDNLKTKRIELSELFHGNSQLYIEGAAGSGKTTLCRYLVSTWANSCAEKRLKSLGPWANQYEALILLPLRRIRTLPESASLKDFVLELYPDLAFDQFEDNKTLFILDGFDEIASMEETTSIEDKRWKIVEALLRKSHWIVTSRPNLFSERFYDCRRFQNIGFTDENIKAYIARFCEDFSVESQGLEKVIFYQEDLKALAHIPLYLELVCSLWKENPQLLSSLNNFATLYNQMAVLLFRRLLMRLDVNTKGLLPKEILSYPSVMPCRECLEAIAFDSKKSGGNRVIPEIYRPLLEPIPATEREAFCRRLFDELGLITPVGDPKELLNQVYSFIHPTFEEYFAARCLISRLDSPSPDVSTSAFGWLRVHCLSKTLEKMIDFAAALATSEKQIDALAEGLLSTEQPKNIESGAWQLPLHRAAKLGFLNLSKYLINKDAKLEASDRSGNRPLHIAASSGWKEVVKLLINKGAKVDAANNSGWQALHEVAGKGLKDVVELLIQHGAKVDAAGYNGRQPLHQAAYHGHKEVVELLIQHGAKVDAACKDGQQPLHEAAAWGHKEVVELLLIRGATIDPADKDGQQPLHMAASSSNKDVVEFLLKKGAKVDAAGKDGEHSLHWAARRGKKELVEFLLEKKAKVDAVSNNGAQPLHWAAFFGHKEVVELLLEHGANVKAVDNNGEKPIDWANKFSIIKYDQKGVVELLLKYEAKVVFADNDGKKLSHSAKLNVEKLVIQTSAHLAERNSIKADPH